MVCMQFPEKHYSTRSIIMQCILNQSKSHKFNYGTLTPQLQALISQVDSL